MKLFKTILLPTDFSACARYAAGNALAFSKTCEADLHILHASLLYENDPNHPDKQLSKEKEQWELLEKPEPYVNRRLEGVLEHYDASDVNVVPQQIRGFSESASILSFIKDNPIDLIIMGTHGRRGFKRWLLGSVAEEIVRMAPCPVITLKEKWNGCLGNLQKILVPIDFSESSRPALRMARKLAAGFGAGIQLLHVIQEPFLVDLYSGAPLSKTATAETESKCRQIMMSMLDEDGPDVPAEVIVTTGHPAREILRFSEENKSDMILMAHHGHSNLPDRIFGSVTEHTVRAATCPVFTVDTYK